MHDYRLKLQFYLLLKLDINKLFFGGGGGRGGGVIQRKLDYYFLGEGGGGHLKKNWIMRAGAG